jgi:hypothetical protein
VNFVAAVSPIDHVADQCVRRLRPSLGQQVGAFVLISHESFRRRVALGEREVRHRPKAGARPGCEELVDLRPAIEADAKSVVFEHSVHLPIRRHQPLAVVIVHHGTPAPVAVVHEVGRVRQDQIHASAGKAAHHVDAVASDHALALLIRRHWKVLSRLKTGRRRVIYRSSRSDFLAPPRGGGGGGFSLMRPKQ